MSGETTLTIVGNLTAEPELRTIPSGVNVCNFTIAATPRSYNRQSQQWEDGQALFMRCTAWRELADHCARSLAKGMRVIARGVLSQESYQAQDGTNRTVVRLTVDEIGPSLRYATAAVAKQATSHGVQQPSRQASTFGGSGWGQASAANPTGPMFDGDPWAKDAPAQPGDEPEF